MRKKCTGTIFNCAKKSAPRGRYRISHERAQCYSAVLVSGSEIVFVLLTAGQHDQAWSYARELAKIWQQYHDDLYVTTHSQAQSDYADFPDAITHALHYRCEPAAPDGSCPWPAPAAVTNAMMHQLLAQ